MKYFDVLQNEISTELEKRGVQVDELLYCVKADLDGEGCYYDVYITFTKEKVCVISGYELYGRAKNNKKRSVLTGFETKEYSEYEL